MRVIKPSAEIITPIDSGEILRFLESCGRVCYKSEDTISTGSASRFIRSIIERGHESVLEHKYITVKFVCDRGVSHEIVRHRIASYSQESTRYCNYGKNKFGNEITVIEPCFWPDDPDEELTGLAYYKYNLWYKACQNAEDTYFTLLKAGASPQEARSVLPNSLKTELIMTANIREWRHFFLLRTSKASHPQMREVANMLLAEFQEKMPVLFDSIDPESEGI
jgi:thymidylate synthase (FAD)